MTSRNSDPQLQRLAASYLDHVLIALQAEDFAANMRNFLDPWWIYERGGVFVHKKRGGGYSPHTFNNPCPWTHRERLCAFDWTSAKAKQIIQKGQAARIINRKDHPANLRLMADHAVPFAVIAQQLWRDPCGWTRESLQAFLRLNFKRAVISFEEDQQLNKYGLRDRMPSDWKFGGDPYARYVKIGIKE